MVNLSGVDLNLFAVLGAVLAERSVTRAAKKLHVTPSAVSNSLARLRELLDDPLVVRSGRGLSPVLSGALEQIRGILEGKGGFVATESTDGLATGEIDAAFGIGGMPMTAGHHTRTVYEEVGALVVRRDHPRVHDRMTPALFNASQHIDVQLALGRTGTGHRIAEEIWRKQGLARDVVLAVPSFLAAAMAAARTDYVAALPQRAALALCAILPLRITRPTFEMPRAIVTLVWHTRTDADAGAKYFRELVARTVHEPPYGRNGKARRRARTKP